MSLDSDPYAEFADAPSPPVGSTSPPSQHPALPDSPKSKSTDPYGEFKDAPVRYSPTNLAPITVSGTTMGFADEAPEEASMQLSSEDTDQFYKLFRGGADAGALRKFVGDRGLALNNADQIVAARDAGRGVVGTIAYPLPKPAGPSSTQGALARGASQGATLGFGDELHAVAAGAGAALSGGNFSDAYDTTIDADRGRLKADEEQHPIATIGGNMVGSLVLPFGLEKAGMTASLEAVGMGARNAAIMEGYTEEQAQRIAAQAITKRMAIEGASYGSAYGAGSATGGIADRGFGAAEGAVGGGLTGAGVGVLAPRLAPRLIGRTGSPPSAPVTAAGTDAKEIAEAAGRLGVPLNVGDVAPGSRNTIAYLESTPGGSGPIQRSVQAGTDAMASRVGMLAESGTPTGREAAGTIITDAGRRAIAGSRNIANKLYDRAQRFAGNTAALPNEAVAALDQHIAELSQTPNTNRGVLSLLTDLRGDLVDAQGNPKPLTIDAIRNMRTAMRGEIGARNLTMSDAERRVTDVMDAASTDVSNALHQSSPKAALAYERADQFYRQRQEYIQDVLTRFLGPRNAPLSGEQAFSRLEAMASPKGDGRRLDAMMRSLTPEERADIAATVSSQMGRRSPDEPFSPALFVSQARRLSPRARTTIFGSDGARAIDDLITVGDAKTATANGLNRSRSGQVANYGRTLANMIVGAGGGAMLAGAPGAMIGAAAVSAAGAGIRNVSARLLTNPAFARWVARMPQTNSSSALSQHIGRLSSIAVDSPALRGEIALLQNHLINDALPSLGRAAASQPAGQNEQQRANGR